MEGFMLVFRKRVVPGERVEEGLRLSAAMLGMDVYPVVVFVDEGVEALLPGAIYLENLREYLRVVSEMAGVYVLEESLEERELTVGDLAPGLEVEVVDLEGFTGLVEGCRLVVSF